MSTRAESTDASASAPAGTCATQITPSLLRGWPLPSAGSDKYDARRGAGDRRRPADAGSGAAGRYAALRCGAGRLTLAVAESVAVQLAVALPEAGVIGLPETAGGSAGRPGLGNLARGLAMRRTPSWCGPGWTTSARPRAAARTAAARTGPSPGSGRGTWRRPAPRCLRPGCPPPELGGRTGPVGRPADPDAEHHRGRASCWAGTIDDLAPRRRERSRGSTAPW